MIFRDKINSMVARMGLVTLMMASLSFAVSAEVFYNQQVKHDGRTRVYQLTVPSSYDGSPVPLIIDIHGWTGWADEQADKSGFRELAEKEGIIVVHPQGWGVFGFLLRSWNAFDCCGIAESQDLDDVGLMRKIVAKVSQEYNIDSSRIYATGHSNGGNMTHKLACEASDLFAGVIPVSFTIFTEEQNLAPCNPTHPISVIQYHGMDDIIVRYEDDPWVPDARVGIERWRDLNNCQSQPNEVINGNTTCWTYSGCSDNVEVTLCGVKDASHEVYTDKHTNINIAEDAWERIKDHTR